MKNLRLILAGCAGIGIGLLLWRLPAVRVLVAGPTAVYAATPAYRYYLIPDGSSIRTADGDVLGCVRCGPSGKQELVPGDGMGGVPDGVIGQHVYYLLPEVPDKAEVAQFYLSYDPVGAAGVTAHWRCGADTQSEAWAVDRLAARFLDQLHVGDFAPQLEWAK